MSRLADVVLSHRLIVFVTWLLIAVAGAATTSRTVDALSYEFGLPGQPAYETNTDIQRTFGGGGINDPLVLYAPAGGDDVAGLGRAAERIAEAAPGRGW
ncbi:MAG: hypothetical protein ACRDXB_17645 [Actinomycetes bacterium]